MIAASIYRCHDCDVTTFFNHAMHSFKIPKSLRYSKEVNGVEEGAELKRLSLLTLLVTKSLQGGKYLK